MKKVWRFKLIMLMAILSVIVTSKNATYSEEPDYPIVYLNPYVFDTNEDK